MDLWDDFLKECVFYPCSRVHGTPVKFLSNRFSRFFYCDYSVAKEDFLRNLESPGFTGYRLADQQELEPTKIFGARWDVFRKKHQDTYSRLPFDSCDPYIMLCTFQREPDLTDEHGADSFQIMFARVEGIAALESAFSRRGFPPKCLVHVRSGIGFGGNHSGYPQLLEQSLHRNEGGLPQFIFHDSRAVEQRCGDHLKLIGKAYRRELQKWGYPDGGFLKLVERNAGD